MSSRSIERALFIRTDRLGDFLMNLPAIHYLRQAYPKCWLAVMVSKTVAPILKGHPDIDEIIEVDPGKFKNDGAERRRLTHLLRQARFDLAIVSNADKDLHWLIYRARIGLRVGWKRKWAFLLNRTLADKKSSNQEHEVDANLNLVRLVSSVVYDGAWTLPVDEERKSLISKRLSHEFPGQRPITVIHAGASRLDKCWPTDRYLSLIELIRSERLSDILLVGGSEEAPRSAEISRHFEDVRDWTGATDLKDLSALLSHFRVRAIVSSDSGPAHVAWLHGKPAMQFFSTELAGSHPARWRALSAGSAYWHKKLDEIQVEEVFAVLKKILSVS